MADPQGVRERERTPAFAGKKKADLKFSVGKKKPNLGFDSFVAILGGGRGERLGAEGSGRKEFREDRDGKGK